MFEAVFLIKSVKFMTSESDEISFVKQLDFLRIVPDQEYRYTMSPNQTIEQFAGSLSPFYAIYLLGKIYIPDYSHTYFDQFLEAREWIVQNAERLEKLLKERAKRSRLSPERSHEDLPEIVRNNLNTLMYLVHMVEDISEDHGKLTPEARKVPVCFTPDLPDFETDLRLVTWRSYNAVRKNAIELKPVQYGKPHVVDQNSLSSSLILLRINQLYLNSNEQHHDEARDMLVGQMFFYYWMSLRRRAISGNFLKPF